MYLLRAEILRAERLKNWPYDPTEPRLSEDELCRALDARSEAEARVRDAVKDFVTRFGTSITAGATEFNVEGLMKIVGIRE